MNAIFGLFALNILVFTIIWSWTLECFWSFISQITYL